MSTTVITTSSPDETVTLGRSIGESCEPGDVILLSGELGTGKTCLIGGIAAGLSVAEYTFSPSFVLVREYHGRLMLYHMDFYRIESPEEAADIGIEEYLYGDGVCAIEWSERASEYLTSDHLSIKLEYTPGTEDSRLVQISAHGARHERLMQQLRIQR